MKDTTFETAPIDWHGETNRLRVLRICQDVPYPPDDGVRIEPFYTTKHLAERGHEISLLAFQEDDRDTTPIRQWCDLRVFPFQRRNSCLRMVQGLLQRVPVNYMRLSSSAAGLRDDDVAGRKL